MGLADRYVEQLKEQGIDVSLATQKKKKDRTRILIAAIVAAVAALLYSLIFVNYNSCTLTATALSSVGNSSIVGGSFYEQCGINTVMYSVAVAILIVVIALLLLKLLAHKKIFFLK